MDVLNRLLEQGLPKEMFLFLTDLHFNNRKSWFQEHRATFEEEVKAPLYALTSHLAPVVDAIYPGVDVRPQRVVSRIYLDARRHHAEPYRDHMWLCFRPFGKRTGESFSLYIYFDLDEWGVGAGYYAPLREHMDSVRHRLRTEGDVFRSFFPAMLEAGYQLHGDRYKRTLAPDLPEDLRLIYDMKSFSVVKAHPIDETVFSEALIPTILQDLSEVAPFIKFMTGQSL